jgi:hypothetical protein
LAAIRSKGSEWKKKINKEGSNNMMLKALSCFVNDTTKKDTNVEISSPRLMCVHESSLKLCQDENECFAAPNYSHQRSEEGIPLHNLPSCHDNEKS